MKLTRLELSGFKSFADTVVFEFRDGVTAIVGPNGCGKSNISDAVRWVLGEQSARLLRGAKMEDVIFQGSAGRRPVNLTEVSLYLDNSAGELPIAYQEVVITRRLSRSGQSEYLLNATSVRLRDIQDLLRGTGLGGGTGVVIEGRMIDLLLSDRAEERRSLFEEAAGIGLYRDRKHSTERRLEDTATDLQRLEDLILEVQSQIRSLARQKGKAERHARLMEEKFAVSVTLARRQLDQLAERAAGAKSRHETLTRELPALRERLREAERAHDGAARERTRAEEHRTHLARQLGECQIALSKLDGELALAAERQSHLEERQRRDEEERRTAARRSEEAQQEQEAAAGELTSASGEREIIQQQLDSRSTVEAEVRTRVSAQRFAVRNVEAALALRVQRLHSLGGERQALEQELLALREQAASASERIRALREELARAEAQVHRATEAADRATTEALGAAERAERARHAVAAAREQEGTERSRKRFVEESLAQLTTRRAALEELERDRVGLAPGAAALLEVRARFDGAVLGPLSDYLSADPETAELAERLLGEWMHAVLVRDQSGIEAIRRWHAEAQPGAVLLLPLDPGPRLNGNGPNPLGTRLRAETPAAGWVEALLSGSEVLDAGEGRGHALRRPSGAILLAGATSTSGPLRRRADLTRLGEEIDTRSAAHRAVTTALAETEARLGELEEQATAALAEAERRRETKRTLVAEREDATRLLQRLTRDLAETELAGAALGHRIERAEGRRVEVERAITDAARVQAEASERLARERETLAALEAEQEAARESRVEWQVREAHLGARVRATEERLARAAETIRAAQTASQMLAGDLGRLEEEQASLEHQEQSWRVQQEERLRTAQALERATAEAEAALAEATARLTRTEESVQQVRTHLDLASEDYHRLEVELTEATGLRRSLVERLEAEWKQPFDRLEAAVSPLPLDREALEAEAARISEVLEAIGPVNPLAVEEHAEESKRLSFLTAQRDDLVAARQSLLQAIKEIDSTARALFLDTFNAIQQNFQQVFHALFGGGECQLRLADPDDPLESEIDIHAAPRGKRVQRIHLLSGGERTLVAVSLLFSIYLSKPSPFCLLDEVDAPLDDANVGRFTTLLDEFKRNTQFIVITHNPRTMQAADAVYGVTMQEPGVSTVVGVRLAEREAAAVG
ncbi:MAG: chromosome segregation protein SMC [Gemmatimonadales bacterium]